MTFLRPTFSRTRPHPDSPFEVLRGVSVEERERAFSGRYGFALVTQGAARLTSDGRTAFDLQAGQGAVLGISGRHVSENLTQCVDFVVVLVDAAAVEAARRRLDLPRDLFVHTMKVEDRRATQAIATLADIIEDIAGEEVFADRLDELLVTLVSSRVAPVDAGHAADFVDAADFYLRSHLDGPVGLETLESLVDIDRLTLTRAFLDHLGETPLSYHLGLRLEEARRQIDRGSAPQVAAHRTGFRSAGDFTRQFRRRYGFDVGRYAAHADDARPTAAERVVRSGRIWRSASGTARVPA